MKALKKSRRFAFHQMICFLISVAVVFFCHKRNPYLGFTSSPASYVLFTLAAVSVLEYLRLCWRIRRQRQKQQEHRNP